MPVSIFGEAAEAESFVRLRSGEMLIFNATFPNLRTAQYLSATTTFKQVISATSTSMKKYRYTPLAPGHSEIRLVRLQPGLPGTDIQIEILPVQLSSSPVYEALSYAWGCPNPTDFVIVQKPLGQSQTSQSSPVGTGGNSNTSLGIAKNLFIALQHLRCPDEPRILWIDAICINQRDEDERSSEVGEMDSIYSNAREVIVWLGPSSHNSGLALQTLRRLGEGNVFYAEEMWNEAKPGSWPDILQNDTEAFKSHADCWFAVKDLLSREWFSRLWVFQEIVLARKARLVVGENSLDWKISTFALEWLWWKSRILEQLIESLKIEKLFSDAIWPFLRQGCKSTTNNVDDTLYKTQNLVCSDPRDRLYAIRSLLYPEHSEIIVPDYSSSVKEVYTNFAKKWLSELDVNILTYCELSQTPQDIDLPSWVPNWSRGSGVGTPNFYGRCSGMSGAFPNFKDDGISLGIQGVLIGRLSYVSPTPTLDLGTANEIREICRSWMQLLKMAGGVGGHSSLDDHFADMIVSGRVSEKLPPRQRIWDSLDEIKAFLIDLNEPEPEGTVLNRIRRAIEGRLFFQTAEGHFGMGPQAARPGDCLAVILGCDSPLILRPDELSEVKRFRVIGPCYVPGIMDAEALLGPLPSGWSAREEYVQGAEMVTIFKNGDTRTQKDPRLPPLLPAWRYIYGNHNPPQEVEPEKLEEMARQWFKNVETGEATYSDPRLTPELLRERGVAIEELILV